MNENFKKFYDSIQNAQDSVAEMESITQKMQNSQFDNVEETNIDSKFQHEVENNQIVLLCQHLIDILSDKESIARFRLENPDILENAVKFAENILQNEQKVIFIGNAEIEKAKYLFNENFAKKYSIHLNPNDNILTFYLKAKNLKGKDRFLNHIFSDKVTFVDETGKYVGDGNKRLEYLNYVIPTIENPLAKILKQDGRTIYVKAFLYDDMKGDKPLKYMVVTEDEQGEISLITSFYSKKVKDVIKIFDEAKEVQINLVPNDTFALSRGGTELKQSSTDETISQDSLNETEVNYRKLQLIVGASNPHTSRPAELNASNETLLGANAHLSAAIVRNFEAISNPAEPNTNISKPQLSDETISQDSLNQTKAKEQGNKMAGVGEQSQSHHLINDFDVLNPADKTISQDSLNQTEIKEQSDNLRDMDSSESNRTIFKLHKKGENNENL